MYNVLVWQDEFDGNGSIDGTKWFHQTLLPNGESWFNGEIQHYTDKIDNAFVGNGKLHLVAKKENYTQQGVTKPLHLCPAQLEIRVHLRAGRSDG
ncbi:MAG: hypothetical protein R2795_02195 [Saprospiraceae bacterium]